MPNSREIAQTSSLRSMIQTALQGSVLLMLTAGTAFAASPQRQDVHVAHRNSHRRYNSLTLRELRLVDASGKTRIIVSARGEQPTFTMLDLHGRVLLSTSLDQQGYGSIQLSNPVDGHPQAAFAIDDKGAHVKFDHPGGASSYMFLNNQGESGAVFLDTHGKRRLDLLVKPDGQSAIERFTDDGKPY